MNINASLLVALCTVFLLHPVASFNVCLINVIGFAECTLGERTASLQNAHHNPGCNLYFVDMKASLSSDVHLDA